MNVKSIDLSIDVTDATGYGQPASIAATVHLPDPTRLAQRPVVCVAFPGGGYSRRYYSMDLPDAPGGQAAWHTDRGWIVVAIDHLQVGDSSVYEPDLLTFEHITAANSAAVEAVLARLAAGTITDGFPAIADPFVAGIGQSMGGCFTVVLQGQRRPFDCIGVLGYSAIHTVVPSAPGVANVAMPWLSRVGYPSSATILNAAALVEAAAPMVSDADELAGAVTGGEHIWTWAFHHDDEPRALVREDMVAMEGGPVPPWRSATTPACAILMVAPGAVAPEAAAITTPVFIAVGERDVVPDPWIEPKAYRSSSDITVAVFPRMAHMHNFAPTRERLWSRLHGWVETLASAPV